MKNLKRQLIILRDRKIKKKIGNFFDWVKGAELIELKTCNIKEDPVRPELMEEKFLELSIKKKFVQLCVLGLRMKFQQLLKN